MKPTRKKEPTEPQDETSAASSEGPHTLVPKEQESHESGIVSEEKNKIFEEHAKNYPEGDPAIRRINPSRDVVGRIYHRSNKLEAIQRGPARHVPHPDFFEVVRKRHSVRSFQDREIENQVLEQILEVIDSAPSAGNNQAYEIVIIRDPERKKQVAQAVCQQEFLSKAHALMVFCANPTRSSEEYGERGVSLYCVQDATIAAAYSQLAATAMGLGSAWVGEFDEPMLANMIGGLKPVAIIALGYATEFPEPTSRRPIDDLVHEERIRPEVRKPAS